ncbi:MAG: hypothetical protein FJW40_11245 [Acidobacteria bacterium]|nr:hypothetical protein [Acidobacteriota bacterium]
MDLERQLIARWPEPEAAHAGLLKQAGIEGVICDGPPAAFVEAARAAGLEVAPAAALQKAVTRGLWPGISREAPRGGGDETASASREPWVDQNGYLAAYERALDPGRVPLIAFEANARAGVREDRLIPFETLELALAEARVNGGNFVLSLDPRYRTALTAGDAKAREAWVSLGQTAAWLRDQAPLLGRPAVPAITALVERSMPSSEIANLLYRRSASPLLVSAASVPRPSPASILVLVAAGLRAVPAAALAHAEAGSTVVIDTPPQASWPQAVGKVARQDKDRTFYTVGRGQVVAYHKRIADPSEFALDVIDLATYRRRAARIWNALAAIPLLTEGRRPGECVLHVINYGSPVEREAVQARVQGHFGRATLLRPGAKPAELKTYRRGSMTEIFLPGLARLAMVEFVG